MNLNNYELASLKERCAFLEFMNKYKLNYSYKFTPISGYEPFDVAFKLKGYNVLEIKNRYMKFDDYWLEKKKLNNIISYYRLRGWSPLQYRRYFMNITESGTYIWNMDLCFDGRPVLKKWVMKSAMRPELGYKWKEFYSLNISEAKYLDFKFHNEYIEKWKNEIL